MQALDLYALVEEYLGFEDEIHELYKTIGHHVLSKEPKTLIDIGCGQGEFCYIMNYNGIKTYGVDLSQKQIELALLKDDTLNVHCTDIKNVKEKFDCATAIFDVINYLPPKELKQFLSSCFNVVNVGGYFIFDINSLYGFSEIATGTLNIDLESKHEDTINDKFIAIDADFEDDTLRTKITLFQQDGNHYKKENGTIKQYHHSNQKLKKILKSVGFKTIKIVDFSLHSEDADKYIFICEK